MIARLSGKLAETTSDSAVIDVGGVGYIVQASARTLDALGPIGGDVLILTELQVARIPGRCSASVAGRARFFRALTSIQGVGGRLALAILSVLSPEELARAVAQEDKAMIGRANGVGPNWPDALPMSCRASSACSQSAARRRFRGRAQQQTLCRHLQISASNPPMRARRSTPLRHELGADASLDALVRLALKKAAR